MQHILSIRFSADGFYFAKSIQLAEYIAKNPELLLENFETKVEIDNAKE